MSFLKDFVDDRAKNINPIHVITAALAAASIVWVSYLVGKNHTLPELSGVAQLLGGAGVANACHKAEDIIGALKKPPDPVTPEVASSHPRDL